MTYTLDVSYFTWLYRQVADSQEEEPSKTYWKLFRRLHTKEFVWIVPNDDNRVEDGKDLRYEFIGEAGLQDVDPFWMDLGCSVLELLVGLSRRLAFECEGQPAACFWQLIENLGLEQYNDNRRLPEETIDAILDQVIWRTYKRNGQGGLFPLRRSREDQRRVELWYQLSAYVLERNS